MKQTINLTPAATTFTSATDLINAIKANEERLGNPEPFFGDNFLALLNAAKFPTATSNQPLQAVWSGEWTALKAIHKAHKQNMATVADLSLLATTLEQDSELNTALIEGWLCLVLPAGIGRFWYVELVRHGRLGLDADRCDDDDELHGRSGVLLFAS
jgi:hypothetical protein